MTTSDRPTVEREADHVLIRIPMKLKKRGGRKEVVVPEGLPSARPGKSAAQEPLVVALARAHQWRDSIESGRYVSIAELARDLGVDRTYVSRLLRLTLLAPKIIASTLRGEEPSGMSFRRLRQIPPVWTDQDRAFNRGQR